MWRQECNGRRLVFRLGSVFPPSSSLIIGIDIVMYLLEDLIVRERDVIGGRWYFGLSGILISIFTSINIVIKVQLYYK